MRMMKYVCLNCRWVNYRRNAEDGVTCNCGGKLDPLGCEENGVFAPCNEKSVFEQTCHTTESLYEAMKALDVLGKEYNVTKRVVVEEECYVGEGPPLRRLMPMSYPEWTITECEPQDKKAETSPGSLQIKIDVDTSSVQEALKDVERLSDELAGLEGQGGVENKLAYLDRLIGIASISSRCGGPTGIDVTGRVAIVCNSIQDELGLKSASQD
ncbi:hypothetical protein [Paenibacillus sp. S150]|uniref:hypothetical protein n=1 Tax=Paenibacillus sp. S150 TaxID=2749826 RepID=UPI001C57EC28|nr:hypothetical protein [Paenibacillus sp. S150]MBW4083517.1 hypothetical protein [Paenibacillus sp. S150]